MDAAQATLLRAGGNDLLLGDFNALVEATTLEGLPKYSPRPTLESLAKIISAQASGPNKDMAVFELCHLIFAVAELHGPEGVMDFLMAPEKMGPGYFREAFGVTPLSPEISPTKDHLAFDTGGQVFHIRYGRMPILCGLYDFLMSMDGFSAFEDISEIVQDMLRSGFAQKSVRTASNAMAAIFRKYRIKTLATQQNDGKFLQVLKFVKERSAENKLNMHDDLIFDFWSLHNSGKDYKGYRTVFDLFCDFQKAFEETHRLEQSLSAKSLGLDAEQGEVDISLDDVDGVLAQEWVSPFDVFDEEGIADIRFFKKKSERAPFEALMRYGPDALRFPLAFLRYETFGQVQSGITNDLQVGRGRASIEQRITCNDVESYEARLQACGAIRDHVSTLQAASLHKLGDSVVPLPQVAQQKSQDAFRALKRKGFDEASDAQHFASVADALVKMATQLDRYCEALGRKQALAQFGDDKQAFCGQFQKLYAEV